MYCTGIERSMERADHSYYAASAPMVSGDILGSFDHNLLALESQAVNEWISECQMHDACRRSISGQEFDPYNVTLPTRCIYVGTLTEPQLRLRKTANETGSYITLSHRWTPSAEACSTKSDNYAQRIVGIDILSLPPHFQQAVLLARQIRVENIWIDSLCIIQSGDEGEDWRSEAKKMGDYYQHALLTIAATSCERLLPTESSMEHPLVRLPYRCRRESNQTGFIYVQQVPYINEQYRTDVQGCELFSRGWVWQEFVLSRRIIWCTSSNIIFECQSAPPSDIFGQSLSTKCSNGTVATLVTKRELAMSEGSLRLWHNTVSEYSGLRFTRPETDRTVALSGLVSEYESIRARLDLGQQPKYTAELWSGYEHIELLWEQVESTPGQHERLLGYPSWSWVSIYTKIMWCDRSTRIEHATPAFSSIRIHDSGPSGENYSQIEIRTRLQSVIVDRKLEAWELEVLFSVHYRPRLIDGLYRAVRVRSKYNALGGWASLENESFLVNAASSSDSPGESASSSITAVHISTTKKIYDGFQGNWYPWYRAYNVLFVQNKHDNVFERVGVGVLFGRDADVRFHEREPQDIVLV